MISDVKSDSEFIQTINELSESSDEFSKKYKEKYLKFVKRTHEKLGYK